MYEPIMHAVLEWFTANQENIPFARKGEGEMQRSALARIGEVAVVAVVTASLSSFITVQVLQTKLENLNDKVATMQQDMRQNSDRIFDMMEEISTLQGRMHDGQYSGKQGGGLVP